MDIAPLVGLFLAMAALNVGLFGWLRADITALRDRMAVLEKELRGDMAALRDCMAGLEKELRGDMAALRDRMAGLEKELRGDMAALRERMARLEGALTGVSPNSPAAANLGADDPDPEPRP